MPTAKAPQSSFVVRLPDMIGEGGRYLPVLYDLERPYWEAASLGGLVLPWGSRCGRHWLPAGPLCPNCLSRDYQWKVASGHGILEGHVVIHRAPAPWYKARLPYVVAQMRLAEGPRLLGNIIGPMPQRIADGLPLM